MNAQVQQNSDHRQIAQKMDLFFFSDQSPGMPYWLKNGLVLQEKLIHFMDQVLAKHKYDKVQGPSMNSQNLLEQSGHWSKYKEDMFEVLKNEQDKYALKAMNCPNAIQFYRHRKRSFRDLPLRLADFSYLYRNEASGALSGLFRVQQFRQDDAHIFIKPEDLEGEFNRLLNLVDLVYSEFQLPYRLRVGGRPKKSIGSAEEWQKAEDKIQNLLRNKNIPFAYAVGEGAFYGPKVDLLIKDSLGREWQMGSIQLDYLLPKRFSCSYQDGNGHWQQPILIHRAILGSFERFLAIYLEHCQGFLPFWLSPDQIRILPISQKNHDFCENLQKQLSSAGLINSIDNKGSIGVRVRKAKQSRVPVIICIGQHEIDSGEIKFAWNGDQVALKVIDAIELLRKANLSWR